MTERVSEQVRERLTDRLILGKRARPSELELTERSELVSEWFLEQIAQN